MSVHELRIADWAAVGLAAPPGPSTRRPSSFLPGAPPWVVSKAKKYRNISPTVKNPVTRIRSEEHTSEPQSLMRISYAGVCLKKTSTAQDSKTIHQTPSQHS